MRDRLADHSLIQAKQSTIFRKEFVDVPSSTLGGSLYVDVSISPGVTMNYSEFVKSRFKSGELIAEQMTPHKLLWLALESRNVCWQVDRLDKVKKYAIYNKTDSEVAGWSQLGINHHKNLKITPQQAELLHAAIGLAGEAGELLDAVRKHIFEGQPLNRENVIEELGDLCFYLEAACQAIKMKRSDIEELNVAKLCERYKDGYSDKQAQDRADKAGAE